MNKKILVMISLFPWVCVLCAMCFLDKVESSEVPSENKKYNFFSDAFDYLMESEGGYENNKYDKGGETKFGISKAAYPHVDIEKLTPDQAKTIYFNDYWLKFNLDKITHKKLSIKVFDTMIVVGARKGTFLLEETVCSLGINIPVDGIMDSVLIDDLNQYSNQERLIDVFQTKLEEYFYRIAVVNKSQSIFLKGWINRARREPLPDL